MRRFIGLGVAAQAVVTVVGHASDGVLTMAGILGTAIPFVLGLWYGTTVPAAMKDAAASGFLIGIVGAAVGTVIAMLLGDQTWMHLTFAPVASGITGLLGGVVGTGHRAGAEPPAAAGTAAERVDPP